MTQISDASDGQRLGLKEASQVFNRPRKPARAPRDIWLPLLALAALLFPLDVAVRRLMWGETELQNLRARLRRPATPRAKTGQPATPERDEAMGALLKAKQRAAREIRQETGDKRQETAVPPGGAVPAQPPGASAPGASAPPVSSAPPQAAPPGEDEEDDDPMARLRRAKRRARGDE